MAQMIVLSRLKDDATYNFRRASLVAALGRLTKTQWDEPTSATVLWHNGTAEGLHAWLMGQSHLYPDEDMLTVLEVDIKSYASSGADNIGLLDLIAKLRDTVAAALMRRS